MTSVTRDKRKYGCPTVYSEKQRLEREQQWREEEMWQQINRDCNEGRRDGWSGRKLPVFYD